MQFYAYKKSHPSRRPVTVTVFIIHQSCFRSLCQGGNDSKYAYMYQKFPVTLNPKSRETESSSAHLKRTILNNSRTLLLYAYKKMHIIRKLSALVSQSPLTSHTVINRIIVSPVKSTVVPTTPRSQLKPKQDQYEHGMRVAT